MSHGRERHKELALNPVLERGGSYPFVRLDERRQQLQRAGGEVFDFGTGDPRELTDTRIRRALIEAVPEVSQYPTVTGERGLREAFRDWARRRHGVELDADTEVLPANGSKEAIFHAAFPFVHHSHTRRGIAYGTPGYPVYERGAAFAGADPMAVRLRAEDGFLLPIEEIDPEKVRILWINYPHNPTGAQADHGYLERVAEFCRAHDILLFSDECYNEIYSGDPPPSILEVTRERVLAVCSLSKRSGMTGYRSAMMAGDPELVAAMRRMRPSIGAATPAFVQAAARQAWSDDEHVQQRRRVFGRKRKLFVEFFERAGLEYIPTDSTFYLWVAAPGGDEEAYALRLAEKGIVVAPGGGFGAGGEGYIRVALVPSVQECKQAIERWRRVEGAE